MYIFKNAMKNLSRNKGRNILISLILLVTMTAVTTCAFIRQAANYKTNEYLKTIKPKINLQIDYERLITDYPAKEVTNIDGSVYYETNPEQPSISFTPEMMDDWSNFPEVEYIDQCLGCDYSTELEEIEMQSIFAEESLEAYYGKDISFFRESAEADYLTKKQYYLSEQFRKSTLFQKLYDDNHTITEDEASELAARHVFGDNNYKEYLEHGISNTLAGIAFGIKMGYSDAMQYCLEMKHTSGMLVSYSDYDTSDTCFSEKALSIKSGDFPRRKNECMVSEQFAEANNLAIGDTINITSSFVIDNNASLDLQISGIFSMNDVNATPLLRYIFTSEETIKDSNFSYYQTDLPTFYLKSIDDSETFEQKLREDGLNEYMYTTSNSDELKASIKPVKKTSQLSTVSMIVIFILGGSIFLLMMFLSVRERKYEIGVLRSIGMKKKNIIQGFIYETATIVLICCGLGIAISTVASQPVADLMMENTVSEESNISSNNSNSNNIFFDANGNELDADNFNIIEGDGLAMEPETEAPQITSFDTYFSVTAVLEIIGAAFILMIAAVIISGLFITSFEPIKILANQE